MTLPEAAGGLGGTGPVDLKPGLVVPVAELIQAGFQVADRFVPAAQPFQFGGESVDA